MSSWFCLPLYLHIFTCTYKGTLTHAHMYNQHTRGISTTRHRNLVEKGGRKAFVRDKGLAHTPKRKKENKNSRKPQIFTNLKKKIRAHRASSKATRLFFYKVIKATSINPEESCLWHNIPRWHVFFCHAARCPAPGFICIVLVQNVIGTSSIDFATNVNFTVDIVFFRIITFNSPLRDTRSYIQVPMYFFVSHLHTTCCCATQKDCRSYRSSSESSTAQLILAPQSFQRCQNYRTRLHHLPSHLYLRLCVAISRRRYVWLACLRICVCRRSPGPFIGIHVIDVAFITP